MLLAERLMHTCYEMYHQMATGVSPEAVMFHPLRHGTGTQGPVRPSRLSSAIGNNAG